MKIVERTINIVLQHSDRLAHHSHETIAAYGDENGYSLYYYIMGGDPKFKQQV
jgi:hypothetical protein